MNRKREWKCRIQSWEAANQSRFPHQTEIPQFSGWAANLSHISSGNCEWNKRCIRKSGPRSQKVHDADEEQIITVRRAAKWQSGFEAAAMDCELLI
jgi:hypothetical protein